MAKTQGLFNNLKTCDICGRPLPEKYAEEVCPICHENNLFHDVKEFIRKYNVNEYQVADRFGISVKQVKGWIREGRIEYKEKDASNSIVGLHCQQCGAPVTFGSLCPKCLKSSNSGKVFKTKQTSTDGNSNKMHYLEQE